MPRTMKPEGRRNATASACRQRSAAPAGVLVPAGLARAIGYSATVAAPFRIFAVIAAPELGWNAR